MSAQQIGAGILFLACFSTGILYSHRYKKRLKAIRMMYSLMIHLENEIVHSREPLPRCFSSFQGYPSEEMKKLFIAGDFRTAISSLPLEKEKEEFISFLEGIGVREIEEERLRIDGALSKFKTILDESEKETAGKRRVAETLGFFVGALLFLLLI